MSETANEETCRRCGHAIRRGSSPVSTLARRVVGRKPPRVQCGEQTDHGWACPCRSRFHAG
ncbi:hypothetical protein [Nocardioides conyzicola]|uniref:hypothetical protein n=1 Tax=Nocardioides conyzicola TaxID=1651781 RepID=UPI0031E6CE2B